MIFECFVTVTKYLTQKECMPERFILAQNIESSAIMA